MLPSQGLRYVAFAGLLLLTTGCRREPRWNVLLLTLDTTRADVLGCYGDSSARTPNLDRLAAQGVLFEHAYASNPVTQPSHSTILTGVYPMVHGVRDNTFFRLPEEQTTLAERLRTAGWATGAAVGGFPLTEEFGTAQGFDVYDDELQASATDYRGRPVKRAFATWYDERPAAHVNDAILPWLREERSEPFFAWLHYWDPHEPHIAPEPYSQLFAHDPYAGEVAYADAGLGVILKALEETGELERTLIVVTADHGEGRFEHREATHAFLAYDATLHVPLIVRPPGGEGGRRVEERVGTVDIVPTVLDLLDLPLPPELQGRSLRLWMEGRGGSGNRRPYYAESLSPRLSHGFGELRALFLGPWKVVHGPRSELFRIDDDPLELEDLADEHAAELERMEGALRTFLAEHASASAASASHDASPETRRRLAALGYLSGPGAAAVSEELRTDGLPPQDRVAELNLQFRLRRDLGAGAFERARLTAERLLEAAPQHVFGRSSLVTALLGLEEWEAALRVVEETEEISAGHQEAYLGLARALFDEGRRDRGLALTRRLAGPGEAKEARVELARMLREEGLVDEADVELNQILELDPGHRDARLERVLLLLEGGSLAEAEMAVRGLVGDHPVDVDAQLAWARILVARADDAGALERLEHTLRLAPARCDVYRERVAVLERAGRAGEAQQAREVARRVCPREQGEGR